MSDKLLIIGGSYAACEIALYARENGYGEDIIIVSEEPELPYHRPPLSKAYLNDPSDEAMPLRAAAFYSENKIELELGIRVVRLESDTNKALLSNGREINFDTLALAVGARARRLSCVGSTLKNVYYLRSIADARLLKHATADAENIVVIGAGFIGLEVASALTQQQKRVTVIEAESRVLGRAVSPEISEFLSSTHRDRGVRLLTSRVVGSLAGMDGVVRAVVLEDGTSINADVVIVGIGSVPNLELAEQLGLHTKNGIVVDSRSRASRPNVYAAGDCTVFASRFNIQGTRLESVQNANDQARVAGAVIAGNDRVYDALPWFWSDQYEVKLQIAGLALGATERVVRRGRKSDIAVFHFKNDTCTCVESINRPREHVSARRLLFREQITKRQLQEVDFDMFALSKTL